MVRYAQSIGRSSNNANFASNIGLPPIPMSSKIIKYLLVERIKRLFKPEPTGEHWCRVVMDQETDKLISALPFKSFSSLEISGQKWSDFGFQSYRSVQYPEFDICAEKLNQSFDIIIAEQVFEHLLWPYRAGRNVFEMVKPGGYFLVSVPFLIKIHLYPVDCTRWSETGLRYFLAECGFDLDSIITGAWGNTECVVSNFNGWTTYREGFHNLKNDAEMPMVTWALAKKI